MENRKPKPRPEQTRCKKHPKHKQAPGVCAICLAERLSRLASSKKPMKKAVRTPDTSSSLSSLSSCESSSNASSCASPVRGKNYVSFLKLSGKNVILTKSRSMEFYDPPRPDHQENTKKGGFWSKLIGSRSKKMDHQGLMHSKTTRERLSSGVR